MYTSSKQNSHATFGRSSIFAKGRTAKSKKYVYAKKSQIPKGIYDAKIDAFVRSHTNAGDESHDVSFTLTDRDGNRYFLKNRIPDESRSMDNFLDAVFDAGLPEGASERDVVGIEMQVTVTYASGATYGDVSFSAKPTTNTNPPSEITKSSADTSTEDYDEWDDDVLLDDDDEDTDDDYDDLDD